MTSSGTCAGSRDDGAVGDRGHDGVTDRGGQLVGRHGASLSAQVARPSPPYRRPGDVPRFRLPPAPADKVGALLAPVAQGIERCPPEACAQVRILPGAHTIGPEGPPSECPPAIREEPRRPHAEPPHHTRPKAARMPALRPRRRRDGSCRGPTTRRKTAGRQATPPAAPTRRILPGAARDPASHPPAAGADVDLTMGRHSRRLWHTGLMTTHRLPPDRAVPLGEDRVDPRVVRRDGWGLPRLLPAARTRRPARVRARDA